jgi:hypothetical protein
MRIVAESKETKRIVSNTSLHQPGKFIEISRDTLAQSYCPYVGLVDGLDFGSKKRSGCGVVNVENEK